ncbi:MAG: ATP-dependent RNA helicase HAS1 [Amphiamblys sp. WSBS2006]|nr:MAG: ATP-dependent RNA helicase HAS1 [Amphiamblys sp. WSBS2006]
MKTVSTETDAGLKRLGEGKLRKEEVLLVKKIKTGKSVVVVGREGVVPVCVGLVEAVGERCGHMSVCGVDCLVLCQEREQAQEIGMLVGVLGGEHGIRSGTIIGDSGIKEESKTLAGVSVAIGTERIFYCYETARRSMADRVRLVVFYCVDRLTEEMKRLMGENREDTQCVVLAERELAEECGIEETARMGGAMKTRAITQKYVLCDSERKFDLLFSLLKAPGQKCVVCSSPESAEFLCEVLRYMEMDANCVYSSMDAAQRKKSVGAFRESDGGVVVCTPASLCELEGVSGKVFIYEIFSSPDGHTELAQRIGGAIECDSVVTIATGCERKWADMFAERAGAARCVFGERDLEDVKGRLAGLVSSVHALNTLARKGYRACVRMHSRAGVESVQTIEDISKSFGLAVPPKVELD